MARGLTIMFLLLILGGGARAQMPTPADCTRACEASNERVREFRIEGKNAHCSCECKEGWTRLTPGSACSRLTPTRAECISDAGYQLIFALRDCKAKPPSLSECLKGTGVSEKTLNCVSALPAIVSSIKNCGILVGTVPLDAAAQCKDISDACITRALAAHKTRIAACR